MEKDNAFPFKIQRWTAEVQELSQTHVSVTLTNRDATDPEDMLHAKIPIDNIPAPVSKNLRQASRFVLQTTFPPQVGQPIISEFGPAPEEPDTE